MKWNFVLGLIFFATCPTVLAQSHPALSGNQLQAMCEDEVGSSTQSVCLGYITGFVAGFSWVNYYSGKCEVFQQPENVDQGQTYRVVTKWLSDHPQKLHEPAETLVLQAMSDYFPCPS